MSRIDNTSNDLLMTTVHTVVYPDGDDRTVIGPRTRVDTVEYEHDA
jgi:hypothetical protein